MKLIDNILSEFNTKGYGSQCHYGLWSHDVYSDHAGRGLFLFHYGTLILSIVQGRITYYNITSASDQRAAQSLYDSTIKGSAKFHYYSSKNAGTMIE